MSDSRQPTRSLEELRVSLAAFVAERDWDQFHSPRNLAVALSVEAGELLEHFQWLTDNESRACSKEDLEEIGREMADVLLYLIRLADKLDVDLVEASFAKLESNRAKYPIERAKGRKTKYTKL